MNPYDFCLSLERGFQILRHGARLPGYDNLTLAEAFTLCAELNKETNRP